MHDSCQSHTSIVDQQGMAVAITSTVNSVFGSTVLDPVTGVLLNDEMDDFSIPGTPNGFGLWPSPCKLPDLVYADNFVMALTFPLPDNYPEPGKRPVSSTVPSIIENPDGSFYAAIGGSGGSRIFGSVL